GRRVCAGQCSLISQFLLVLPGVTMNRLTCTLLSGASIFALAFGGDIGKGISARAATAPGPGSYATTGDEDYIIITGDHSGSVTVSTGDTVGASPFDGPLVVTPFGTLDGLFGIVNAS